MDIQANPTEKCSCGKAESSLYARPWGTYEIITSGENYCVKMVTVHPECSISLQLHNHRAEYWTVVSGIAHVECDGVQKTLLPTQAFAIPVKTRHRLSNFGIHDLQIIEVQTGSYIGEDDIERFEDDYGRVTS